MIYGNRVREVRELRGLSQSQLAESVGVDNSAIAHIEAGRLQPSPELIDAIAQHTGFPSVYFEQDEAIDLPLGSLLFRARSDASARERAQAHRFGELIYRKTRVMAGRLSVPPVRLPHLELEPVQAAAHTRAALGLSPDGPIPHLINAAERAGVFVLAVPVPRGRREAYSVWVGDDDRAVIVLLGDAPGDRLRFSVAHELGHLVRRNAQARSDTPATPREIEREADSFASALLLPAESMRREIVPPVTLSSLASLKPRWGVSVQTLIRRAKDLEIITQRQYGYLFEQVGKRGWRLREPANLDVPVEKPRAVRKMAELLFGDPIEYLEMGNSLHIEPMLARQIVEAHGSRSDLPRKEQAASVQPLQFRRLRSAPD